MVVIVAFLLAFVASALKPTQDANVAKDKKSQILAALNIRDIEDVEGKYAEVIKKDAIYGADASQGVKSENGGEVSGVTSLSMPMVRQYMAPTSLTSQRLQASVPALQSSGSKTVSKARKSLPKAATMWHSV